MTIPPTNSENSPKRDAQSLWSFVLFVLIVMAIVLPIRLFVAKPFLVSGTSMLPTFDSFNYLIIDQLTYKKTGGPKRGDVIIFRFPQDPKRFFIKRVIGLPGDTVELRGEHVIISNTANPDGFDLNEPYVDAENQLPSYKTTTLGSEEYFVLGDNRKDSADSRYWGALPKENITGRAFIRLFPFTDIALFPGKTTY